MGLFDTTTYRVEADLVARDHASLAFAAVTKSAEAATKSVDLLKRGLTLLGVGLGFNEAKKSLIDFNKEMEDSRVVMSGMLTMFTGAPMEKAWDRAGQSVDTFNKMAAKSSLTTKDLINMASLIERPLLQAGVSMNMIETMTFGAANAAKAFGISAEVAAMDIQQALGVGVHIKDRFAMSLLAQKGIDYTPAKFNALDISHRAEILSKATQSKAIAEMSKKQGEDTFSGVSSTLADNVGIAMGKLGLPLFREITHEIQSWNAWMDKNAVSIQRFANVVSDQLVEGFKYIKGVAQFLNDHSSALIEVGKIWAISKLGGSVGGGIGLGGGNLSAITSSLGPMGDGIGKAVRAGVLSAGLRFPGLIGPMNSMMNAGAFMGRLGSAAGALGPGGVLGIGMAAHELGEYLGVHRALTAAIDPARMKLVALKTSMDIFDDSLKRTANNMSDEKGGLGTVSAKNALGAVDFMKMQLNVLQDVQAGRGDKNIFGMHASGNRRDMLLGAGFDADEAQRLRDNPAARMAMISSLTMRMGNVGGNAMMASHETDRGLEAALKLMTPEQRASIDMNKATQLVMEKFMQLFSSSGYGMSGLNAALMSPEEIKKMTLRDSLDPFKGGANFNQNITNNIKVEVAAKDPDRWIMELDQKIARKIKAPSQARGSIITRGGL